MLNRTNPIPQLITHALCWLCLAAFASPAAAASVYTYWQHDPATPGDWFDPVNWDQGVPVYSAFDRACIDNEGIARIASPGAECYYLGVGYTAGQGGTLELSGESSSLSSYCQCVGCSGTGAFVQNGGSNSISRRFHLGYSSGSIGTYELHAGELSASEESVGYRGTGTFIQNGGSNATGYLCIGDQGCYVLNDGTFQVTDGATVTGTLDFVTGKGSIVMAGLVNLGEATLINTGSTTFTLGLNSLLIVPADFDPETEFAEFISNGSHVHQHDSTLFIGAAETIIGRGTIADPVEVEGSLCATTDQGIDLGGGLRVLGSGSVNLGTGKLYVDDDVSGISDAGELVAGREIIGYEGTGTFIQNGGSNSTNYGFYLGFESGSSGTYELHAGGLSVDYNHEYIGYYGTGTFIQNGGSNSVGNSLYLGYMSDSSGTYELYAGELSTYSEYIGCSGTGTFTQTGGTNSVSHRLYLGPNSGSNGTYELSGTGQLSAEYEYVGNSGTGTFTQTGGTNTVSSSLLLGSESGSSGTYELSGTGQLSAGNEHVGNESTGTFTQTGGTNTVSGFLRIGYDFGSSGTYELSGTGQLSARNEHVGHYGTGTFTQTGGTNTVGGSLSLGYDSGSSGTYQLSGTGQLSAEYEYIGCYHSGTGTFTQTGGTNTVGRDLYLGYYGTGTFSQTGGTNTVGSSLYLGFYSSSNGTYELSGTGQLSAGDEYVGYYGTGALIQYGGSNATAYLSIGDDGSYVLYGGTLQVTEGATIKGELDFVTGDGSVTMAGLVNLGEATLSNASSATFVLGSNSLLIVPAGFDPETDFSAFINNESIVHNHGSTLHIPNTKTVIGRGTIADRVAVQGSLHATSSGGIDLESGLQISGNGSVDLGTGHLIVEDNISGICDSGQLSAEYEYVGYSGTGTFSQTGGTNTVGSELYLDYGFGFGTYELSGTGQLSAEYEYVGRSGTGTFSQTGGTNTVGSELYLGYGFGSSGIYQLSGTGQLSAEYEYVGRYGTSTGTFTQTGGTNTVGSGLYLGYWSGSNGTYTISAGQLATPSLYVGYYGRGTLNITDPAVSITVSSLLRFGPYGTLAAVPGSAIHMTGSAFENESTDANALAGLANLTLIFEGGAEDVDPFEVAGEDLGAVREGFDGNFVLDTLQLGGEEGVGKVQLVDLFDNQPEWEGSEALYVENLLLGDGSLLHLNGLNLYYRTFTDLGGTIEMNGGGMFLVSIPGDANCNGVVNDQDASILASHWQQSGMSWENGDFNNDGIVNDQDASILAAHWQQTWEGEGAAAVPEPSVIVLCIPPCLAGLLLGRRRHRRLV